MKKNNNYYNVILYLKKIIYNLKLNSRRGFKLFLLGSIMFLANVAKAQVEVTVNIGSPPQWGPVGYTEVRYYYLPDVEAYYDIQSSMFIYYGGGLWVRKTYLPRQYRNYDLYSGYKVVMTDYHGNTPYIHFKEHKTKYIKGYRGQAQKTIGQKPEKENPPSKRYSNKNSGPGKEKNVSGEKSKSRGSDQNMKKDKGRKK